MRILPTVAMFLALLAASPVLTGCDGGDDKSRPSAAGSSSASANARSDADIEAAVKEDIATGSGGKLRLASLKKTDGKGDANLYIAYVDADVEVVEDIKWGVTKATDEIAVTVTDNREDFNEELKKGQTLKLKTVARMEKRESGWKLEDHPRFRPRQ